MILAAGFGKRMQPLTLTTPKPLLRVNDKPLIEYHIEALVRAGVESIVINLGWLGEQISQQLGDGSRWGVELHYSFEPEPLETAGGIYQALSLLGDAPFIVVNGDVWTDFDYRVLKVDTLTGDDLAYLVLVANPEHNPDGDFLLQQGRIANPNSDSRQPGLTFAGISVISPRLFNGFDPTAKAALSPLLRAAADTGKLAGQHFTGEWLDIGTPERLELLNNTVSQTKTASD
ncbi:N-acetylmuramate alpha-1-phosphate uridylyltransferase MurU [Sinobacterium norvegicum]|nr:nucleotidyltransferase family protein [Sinobacterium norvegicum]